GTERARATRPPAAPARPSYGAAGRHRGTPRPIDTATLRLLESQRGRCPLCGELLLDADRPPQSPREWEQWLTVTRKAMTHHAITAEPGAAPDEAKLRLLHAHCHRQHAGKRNRPALLPASAPSGLA